MFHARQRRLMQPAFNRRRIAGYVSTMIEQADALARSWTEGQTVPVAAEFHRLSSNIIARTLFPDASSWPVVDELQRSLSIVLRGVILRTIIPYRVWENVPTRGNRRYRDAVGRVRHATGELIATVRSGRAEPDGLLTALASTRDDKTGDAMTDSQLVDEVTTLFAAGTETASVTLSWLFYELSRHPLIESRLHEELDVELGTAALGIDTLGRLPYCRRVIEETLRLHTPTWLLSRRSTTGVRLGGWSIQAGTEVIYSPTTMHRDPHLFPDPMNFDPDRWLPDRRPDISSFIPFNLGVRKCIGDHYAMTEMMVTAAIIATGWSLRTAQRHTVRQHISTTVHPGNLLMCVSARHSAVRS
jgi:cytochrome P450